MLRKLFNILFLPDAADANDLIQFKRNVRTGHSLNYIANDSRQTSNGKYLNVAPRVFFSIQLVRSFSSFYF